MDLTHTRSAPPARQRRVRRGSVEIAVGAIKTFAKWTVKPMTDGGATPRPLKSEITRQSNVDDVRMWLTTCFMDLELDSSEYTPWVRRFYEEQVDGEALLAIHAEDDLANVFLVDKKGIRLRILNDIQEERASNRISNELSSDMLVKHSCFILFGVCALGAMMIYLSFILIPLVCSFVVYGFLVIIVDFLSVRPHRFGRKTYAEFCVDGYKDKIPAACGKDHDNALSHKVLRAILLGQMPRWLACLVAIAIFFFFMAMTFLIVYWSVADAIENQDIYEDRINGLVNATRDMATNLGYSEKDMEDIGDTILSGPVTDLAISVASTVGTVISDFIIVVLFACYLVMEKPAVEAAGAYINFELYKSFLLPFSPAMRFRRKKYRSQCQKDLPKRIKDTLKTHYATFLHCFSLIDVNGDGILSSAEFREGLKRPLGELDRGRSESMADAATMQESLLPVLRFKEDWKYCQPPPPPPPAGEDDVEDEIETLRKAVINMRQELQEEKKRTIAGRVKAEVITYVQWKMVFSILSGVAMSVILVAFRVDLYAMFGFCAFCLNFIPTLGGLVACCLTVPMLILDPHLTTQGGVVVFICLLTMQLTVTGVLEPLVFASRFNVHPLAVLVSLALWMALWGIVGAMVSTPFLVVVMIFLQKLDHPAAKQIQMMLRGSAQKSSASSGADTGGHEGHDPTSAMPRLQSNPRLKNTFSNRVRRSSMYRNVIRRRSGEGLGDTPTSSPRDAVHANAHAHGGEGLARTTTAPARTAGGARAPQWSPSPSPALAPSPSPGPVLAPPGAELPPGSLFHQRTMEELRTLSRSSSNGTKILEQDPEAVKIAMQARRVSWGDVCVQIGRRTSTNLTNLNNPFMKEGTQSAPPGGGMSSLPEVDDGEEGDAADSGPPLTPHSGLSKLDGLDGSRRPLGASPEAGTPPPSTPPGGPHYADAAANDLNSSIHSTISTMTLTGADDDFEDDEPSPWHPSMAQELEEEDSDADSDADSEDSLEGAKAVGGALAQAEEAKASTPPATESVSRESTPPRMSPSRARTPPGPAGASTVSTE